MRNIDISVFFILFLLGGFSSAQSHYNVLMYEGNQAFNSNRNDAATSKFMEVAKNNENDFAAHYNLETHCIKVKNTMKPERSSKRQPEMPKRFRTKQLLYIISEMRT